MEGKNAYYFDYVITRMKQEDLPNWNQIEVGRFIRKVYYRLNSLLGDPTTRDNVIKRLKLGCDARGIYKIPDPVLNVEGGGAFYKIYTRRTRAGSCYARNVFALYYGYESYEDLIIKEKLYKGRQLLDVQIILNGNRSDFDSQQKLLFKQVVSAFLGISLEDVRLLEVMNSV